MDSNHGISILQQESGSSDNADQRSQGEANEIAISDLTTKGSTVRRARATGRFDNIGGLGSANEIISALTGNGSSDAAIRGKGGEILLDNGPGCLGTVVANDAIRDRDIALSGESVLNIRDEVIDAQSADSSL